MTINMATDDQRFSELTDDSKRLLRKLWVIKAETLCRWGQFRRFEEIRDDLVRLPIDSCVFAKFISHRWEKSNSPDPYRCQYQMLSPMLSPLVRQVEQNQYYWYDYSCMPQNPQSYEDAAYIEFILQNLNEIVRTSKMIILRMPKDDYFSRGWCFHECFTAQYTGMFDRDFLTASSTSPGLSFNVQLEIVQTKHRADMLLGGDYGMLPNLSFSKESDREIVYRLTRQAAVKCQRKICKTCIEFIGDVVEQAKNRFPVGLYITIEDIHERFTRLVMFIKTWTRVMQPVEAVSDRLAMFLHKSHWDALVGSSQPIAVDLLSIEYSVPLRDKEILPVDSELREVYEYCQTKMPEARYAVTAFLCFFLMGYDIYKRKDYLPTNIEDLSAAKCGRLSQRYLNAGQYDKAEAYAQVQLRKAQHTFDDRQTEKALSKLGRIYRNSGDFYEACKYYQRSLNLSRQLDDKQSVAIAYDQLGSMHRLNGDIIKAIDYYRKSLKIHLSLKNEKDIGVEYGNLGGAYRALGEIDNAHQLLLKAIQLNSKVGDYRNLSIWYYSLGKLYDMKSDEINAKQAYQNSLLMNRMVGNREIEACINERLASLKN